MGALGGFMSGLTGGGGGDAAKKAAKKLKDWKPSSSGGSDTTSGGSPGSDVGDAGDPSSFKKGGMVKKTGMAKVHKGERVLTKKQNKRYSKMRGK
jgi:hypothetical protein